VTASVVLGVLRALSVQAVQAVLAVLADSSVRGVPTVLGAPRAKLEMMVVPVVPVA
jgi:hypothetical protein